MAIDTVEREEDATLREALWRHWGMRVVRIQPLASGHTNKSFLVNDGAREWVLRRSWAGKTQAQVSDETRVLEHLRGVAHLPASPSPIVTLDGRSGVQEEMRWLHLFPCIPGIPGVGRHIRHVEDAMRTLGRLHQALNTLPVRDDAPLTWLRQRLDRVRQRPAPLLPPRLPASAAVLLDRIQTSLDEAAHWELAPVQWLHGDYHAGNLLHFGGRIVGVLDFDDVGQGSPSLETAFALFALTRDADVEDELVFDAAAWDAGLMAYASIHSLGNTSWLRERRDALTALFCADQSLIHLEAAQRGLWALGPGIGFLASCHHLLATRLSGT